MSNNTYKGVRIVHQNYDLYYSAWCTNEHELYDLKVCLASLTVDHLLTKSDGPRTVAQLVFQGRRCSRT